MFKILKVENIKSRRTFLRKFILISPLFFSVYAAVILAFIDKNSPKYFINMVYNWWPLIFMPLGTALVCALSNNIEKKAGNYKGMSLINISRRKIWIGKILIISFYLFIASLELFFVVLISNIFIKDYSSSNMTILIATFICWIVSLMLIPIYLFLASWIGVSGTIIISLVGTFLGVLESTGDLWMFLPWSYGLRLMCPIIGVNPNGTALPRGSYLLNPSVIVVGTLVSIFIFIIATILSGIWFNKREVH